MKEKGIYPGFQTISDLDRQNGVKTIIFKNLDFLKSPYFLKFIFKKYVSFNAKNVKLNIKASCLLVLLSGKRKSPLQNL